MAGASQSPIRRNEQNVALRFTFHALLQGLVQLVSGAARGHHDKCIGFD